MCCPLCRTVSASTVDHPLLETLLLQSHERQAASQCGQCAERGGRASAAGTCIECQTDLCHACIEVTGAAALAGSCAVLHCDDHA